MCRVPLLARSAKRSTAHGVEGRASRDTLDRGKHQVDDRTVALIRQSDLHRLIALAAKLHGLDVIPR